MEIKIKATGLDLTNDLRDFVNEKIKATTEKFFKGKGSSKILGGVLLEIDLARTTKHHGEGRIWKCEINLSIPKVSTPIRIEVISEDIKISINKSKQELERELRKLKTKRIAQFRKAARYLKNKVLKRS